MKTCLEPLALIPGVIPGVWGPWLASLAVYTLLRQGIRRLRTERPASGRGGAFTAAAAFIVLLADLVYLATSPG